MRGFIQQNDLNLKMTQFIRYFLILREEIESNAENLLKNKIGIELTNRLK